MINKKSIFSLISALLFSGAVFAQDESVRLKNYETGNFENVNVSAITEHNYAAYLPDSKTVRALFGAYIQKGEPVNLALLSTLMDIHEAEKKVQLSESSSEKETMFNFKMNKKETVDISSLSDDEAKNFIPQYESLFRLFDFYRETSSVEDALYQTLVDASSLIEKNQSSKSIQ